MNEENVVLDRFYTKIVKRDTGCWSWIGAKNDQGYGYIGIDGVVHRASRVSYVIHKGPIPEGTELAHSCDNKRCVNPDHLFAKTRCEHMRETFAKGQKNHKGSNNPSHIKKMRFLRKDSQ